MSQLDEAVARYNKLLETGPFSDLAWAEALHERMESGKLSAGGRLICPFLRPNLISRRQYDSLVKNGELLISAIGRLGRSVRGNPASQGIAQEISDGAARQPQVPPAGLAEIVQAVRRRQEAEY